MSLFSNETDIKRGVPSLEITEDSGRIFLSQFQPGDAHEIFELIDANRSWLSQNGDVTAKNYPTEDDVRNSILHPKNPAKLRFAIRSAEDGSLLGSINFIPDDENTTGEVGYYLAENATGNGYIASSIEMLNKYLASQGYESVYAHTVPQNTPSQRVLEKAGFVRTAQDEARMTYSLDLKKQSKV